MGSVQKMKGSTLSMNADDNDRNSNFQNIINEEENIICGRFPHMKYCACPEPCIDLLSTIHPTEVKMTRFLQVFLSDRCNLHLKPKSLLKIKSHIF